MLPRTTLIHDAMNDADVSQAPVPSGRVFCFKPCREEADMVPLDPDRPAVQAEFGIDTCVFVDLNVLDKISTAVTVPVSDQSEELRQEIAELKAILSLPSLHICAGPALEEAHQEWLDPLLASYERFMQSEIPTYRTHPKSITPSREIDRTGKFLSLRESEQRFFALSHLCMLKFQEILVTCAGEAPERQFDEFLQYMDKTVDCVPRLEIEAAKHCFFQPASSDDSLLAALSRKIRKNLMKGGRGEKLVDKALNAARDLMLVRGVSLMDGDRFDGRRQDAWLLTRDAGLAALCATTRFVPGPSGTARWMTETRYEHRDINPYWRHVDKAYIEVDVERASRNANWEEPSSEDFDRTVQLCRELHVKLAQRTD